MSKRRADEEITPTTVKKPRTENVSQLPSQLNFENLYVNHQAAEKISYDILSTNPSIIKFHNCKIAPDAFQLINTAISFCSRLNEFEITSCFNYIDNTVQDITVKPVNYIELFTALNSHKNLKSLTIDLKSKFREEMPDFNYCAKLESLEIITIKNINKFDFYLFNNLTKYLYSLPKLETVVFSNVEINNLRMVSDLNKLTYKNSLKIIKFEECSLSKLNIINSILILSKNSDKKFIIENLICTENKDEIKASVINELKQSDNRNIFFSFEGEQNINVLNYNENTDNIINSNTLVINDNRKNLIIHNSSDLINITNLTLENLQLDNKEHGTITQKIRTLGNIVKFTLNNCLIKKFKQKTPYLHFKMLFALKYVKNLQEIDYDFSNSIENTYAEEHDRIKSNEINYSESLKKFQIRNLNPKDNTLLLGIMNKVTLMPSLEELVFVDSTFPNITNISYLINGLSKINNIVLTFINCTFDNYISLSNLIKNLKINLPIKHAQFINTKFISEELLSLQKFNITELVNYTNNELKHSKGIQYNFITFSFANNETPEIATAVQPVNTENIAEETPLESPIIPEEMANLVQLLMSDNGELYQQLIGTNETSFRAENNTNTNESYRNMANNNNQGYTSPKQN